MISRFIGEYDFLSNFYPSDIEYGGVIFKNAEAAFQAQKDPSKAVMFSVLNPSDAKRMGRSVNLRDDWDSVKYDIMYNIVYAKFTQNKQLMHILLCLRDYDFKEGNWWHDNTWGDCKCERCCDIEGKNYLGKILHDVKVRIEKENLKNT